MLQSSQKYIEVEVSGGITDLKGEKGVIATLAEKNKSNGTIEFNPNTLEHLNNSIDLIFRKKDFISDEMTEKLLKSFQKSEQSRKFENKENLTKREIEVLKHLCLGMTNQQIAEELYVSVRTVDSHRSHLLEKTNSKNTAQLIIYAIKNGVIDLSES
jgi:DNA-binding NarL/FixJ family response regulator